MVRLIAKNGCVYLHDTSLGKDVIAFTPHEAHWFRNLLVKHISTEFESTLYRTALAAKAESDLQLELT